MNRNIMLIKGGRHIDDRGIMDYVNEFDMSQIKRMYIINHPDTIVKRGWRAHKLEQRWFYVVKGRFEVNLVKINDFQNPDPNQQIETYELTDQQPIVIHVPVGYASALRALENDSKIIVYADASVELAKNDNYQYSIDYFVNWK
jgi:dTDP-4-dehydrorhamnose 3,5-epimerase-like enzyme